VLRGKLLGALPLLLFECILAAIQRETEMVRKMEIVRKIYRWGGRWKEWETEISWM
jgi:hypothetical protein